MEPHRTFRGRSWRRIATSVVTATILTACSVTVEGSGGTATTRADVPTGRSSTPTTRGTDTGGSTIRWHTCDDVGAPFRSATVAVPLDHAEPDGPTIDIALVELPASGPDEPIGPLLVNPGGPGGSGIDFVTGNLWPRELTRNFDIIGFDPRGVGASTPIDCGFDIGELYDPDPAPRTPAAVDELEEVSRAYVDACAEHAGDMLPHMGTRDVAADIDDVRVALGVDRISYLGYSYGTSIGQVYADTYPDHVRAMVLDGVVRLGEPGIQAATAQGLAFDKVLRQFFAACATLPRCPTDPEATFDAVRDRTRTDPLPTDEPGRRLTPGMFQLGVGQGLYVEWLWPDLSVGLADAVDGDGTALLAMADDYLGRDDPAAGNQTDVYFAVSCLDWDWPDDPATFLEAGRSAARTSPWLVEGIIEDYIRCAWWPVPPRPLTRPKAKGAPLIVVVSTTDDPATPYRNGVDLADTLPDAALVTKVGADHTAYGHGDSCVDDAINAYLVSLRRPPEDLRCE